MKLNVYTIRDAKVGAYAQPYFSPTHGSAIRAFADHVNETGTAANKHPEDFSLYVISTYDDQAGTIDGHPPQHLGEAAEYLNNKE